MMRRHFTTLREHRSTQIESGINQKSLRLTTQFNWIEEVNNTTIIY